MRARTPDVYVLPNRPSFTGGSTDSIEYAWFVWRTRAARSGTIRVLAETGREERIGAPKGATEPSTGRGGRRPSRHRS
jgi:hypothetical protein